MARLLLAVTAVAAMLVAAVVAQQHPCAGLTCSGRGRCEAAVGCICWAGYEGTNCERESVQAAAAPAPAAGATALVAPGQNVMPRPTYLVPEYMRPKPYYFDSGSEQPFPGRPKPAWFPNNIEPLPGYVDWTSEQPIFDNSQRNFPIITDDMTWEELTELFPGLLFDNNAGFPDSGLTLDQLFPGVYDDIQPTSYSLDSSPEVVFPGRPKPYYFNNIEPTPYPLDSSPEQVFKGRPKPFYFNNIEPTPYPLDSSPEQVFKARPKPYYFNTMRPTIRPNPYYFGNPSYNPNAAYRNVGADFYYKNWWLW